MDGALVKRHIGGWPHSLAQSNIIYVLSRKYRGIYAVPSLRCRTRGTRYRIPDEVLEKLQEYAAKGTPHIWIVDPRLRQMFSFQQNCPAEVEGILLTADPYLELTRDDVLAA
ncbi:MAG TPA: hypothetical protein VME43_19405 [Bryobacteraceae bacterium]|nr:hypothetical protein [Bryobacteraceae bacterium]